MGFEISQKTLERLEWPEILARLGAVAVTPGGRGRCQAGEEAGPRLFESTREGVFARLAETREARAVPAEGDLPPLGGVADVSGALARAQAEPEIELLAEECRLAARELGRITGRVDVEDLLDVVFSDFCIGK